MRDRFFAGFGKLGIERPWLVVITLAILTVIGGALASQLTISTSRFSLVADDNYYQSRMIRFFDAFGYPDSPVAIIEGGTPEQRRETVDRLVEKLDQEDAFRGRWLAKVDAETVAETLLVQQPGTLARFRASLPPDAALEPALEQGLEGAFGLIETQLLAALDGEVDVQVTDADAQMAQLAQLGALATALDRKLAADAGQGEPLDAQALLSSLAGPQGASMLPSAADLRTRGLDEKGYLVSNDGERLLVAIFPEFGGDEVSDYDPAVIRLREIRDELELGDTQIVYTGLPFLVVDEEAVLQSGLVRASVVTMVGIFLLLFWAFRSWRRSLVSLLPILVGMVVSFGALYLLFDTLDPITSGFGAVLMGLGIDFAVHLLARYDEDLQRGWTRREAMRSALIKSGPGIVTGALTTALAFLTIATTEFTSYGEMGVITAIGLVVTLLVTLLLLPVVFGRGNVDIGETPPKPLKFIELIPRFTRKAPILVLLVGIGLAFAGAVALPPYNPRYLDLLPKGYEASVGLAKLERDGAMTPWFAWVTADDLDQARERTEALRHQDSVGRVDSPTDLLPELTPERLAGLKADFAGAKTDPDWTKLRERKPSASALAIKVGGVVDALDELAFGAEQAGRDVKAIRDASKAFADLKTRLTTLPAASADATLDRIEDDMANVLGRAWTTAHAVAERGHWQVDDLPEQFRRRFVASDGSGRLAIYVYPAELIWDSDATNAKAQHFTEQLEAIDPNVAGQGITLWYHNEMIINGFRRATIYSVLLVVAFLLLDFGSIRLSLLALFPVVIGMGWMIGLFNVFDLRLNVATIVVIPLTLGIGVDAGVHMIHRWDRNARKHGGKAKLEQILRGTGGAVILSSLTTIVGFAGLLLGRHGGLINLGSVMVIAIACTTLASVFMLPALLLILDKAE
ncbi:efflux RND transporter permease subunit [Nannocystaceae bacterium ST9]